MHQNLMYMKKILFVIVAILTLSACSKKDDPEPAPGPTPVNQHTVLVYMAGENNLSHSYDSSTGKYYSCLDMDLSEMIEGSYQLADNQHLIAFVDSTGSRNYPHIYEIAGGKATEVYRYSSDFYSSDPDKFREIIQWTIDNYPSDDYALVLWGHATGWAISTDTIAQSPSKSRAYGIDQGTDITGGSTHWMNITQMARALDGLPKFRYIFADCCCFQCIESAYELRKAAGYLIGSPAEIPDLGAPYDKIVPALFSQSADFYKQICDVYYDYYFDQYQLSENASLGLSGYSVPMSAIDLSQMDNLASATATAMRSFMPQSPEELDLSLMPFYFDYDKPVMYDVKSVFHQYAPETAYTQWLKAYDAAVPYQLPSLKWLTIYNAIKNRFNLFPSDASEWGCTSMFFPQATYAYATFRYNQRISLLQWYNAVNWSAYGW